MHITVPKTGIITVFGSIRCGKTTYAARIVKQALRQGRKCYADLAVCPIKGCYDLDPLLLGTVTPPPGSVVIIDEAGIALNNRQYKSFPRTLISWLKLSGHYKCVVYVLSQSWDDMDITVRRLSTQLLYLRRLGPWTLCRPVRRFVTVDKDTDQIVDGYEFYPIWFKFLRIGILGHLLLPNPFGWILRGPLYKMFDSYVCPPLPFPSETLLEEQTVHKQRLPEAIGSAWREVCNRCRALITAFRRPPQ